MHREVNLPFHKIDKENSQLHRIEPTSFVNQKWRERRDLQALLRDNPEAIDKDIFIIAEEFSSWEDSSRRVDLLGLDRDGNLVVIELKRQEDRGHMELQAVRYAAMLSAMDFAGVVRVYEEHLMKLERDPTDARQVLQTFLELERSEAATITSTPRIILVAPGFSREITTTVLWLNDQGLNIQCIEANLYKLNNDLYLDIEQVIPLPSASEYQVKIREKTIKAEREASSNRRKQSLATLVAHNILKPGTRIHLIHSPKAGLNITDDKAKYATYVGATGGRGQDFK
jgi:hypothetical protein